MVPEATSYRSPKRKREALDFEDHSPVSPPASPISTVSITSFPEARLREEEDFGRYSPRAAVAGRLKELAIQEASINLDSPHSISIENSGSTSESAEDFTTTSGEIRHPSKAATGCIHEANSHAFEDTLEIEKDIPDQPFGITKKVANKPPRNKSKANSPTKSRRKSSPPPSDTAITNDLTWSDSEITGHNPTDPSDDGYGINGIGFRPTAATAWVRSQKRQKQVTEWKNREANEARERRRERREGMSQIGENRGTAQKKVKFDLG